MSALANIPSRLLAEDISGAGPESWLLLLLLLLLLPVQGCEEEARINCSSSKFPDCTCAFRPFSRDPLVGSNAVRVVIPSPSELVRVRLLLLLPLLILLLLLWR